MYKLKVGKSITLDEKFTSNLNKAIELGFDSIDLDLNIYFGNSEVQFKHYLDHIFDAYELVKKSGLILNAIHLPYGYNMDFSEPNEENRTRNVLYCKKVMDLTKDFSNKYYVFHGSCEPISDEEREARKKSLHKSLKELLKFTDKTLCLENLPRTCLANVSTEILDFVDNNPGLCICLDMNHSLKEKTEDVIMMLGSRIKTLHVSDYDLIDEKHWMPKKGKNDWNKIIGNLEKIGYSGVFNYEVKGEELADIRENFDVLFNEYNS